MLAIGSSVTAPRRVVAGAQQAALPRRNSVVSRRPTQPLAWKLVPALSIQTSTCKVPAAASAAAPCLPTCEERRIEHHQAGIFEALRHCRSIFSCFAFCAVYAYLSWGLPAGTPFASATLAIGEAPATGLTSTAKSAWAGLAAGFLHTLCGPDHLAALTPLTIGRNRFAASALGALWGFGHSTGQLILGLVFVVLKERFHDLVPFLSKWASTVVPLTLIAIGMMGIYESFFEKGDAHAEAEAEAVGLALAGGGSVSAGSSSSSAVPSGLKAGFATYATGIVYGLQPDALFVVIPALALPTKLAAIAYCSMFVIGTVSAMGGYTLLIGTTSQALIKEQPWLQKHLSTVASGIAIAVGLLMLLAGWGMEVPFFS
ncbi:hypothetical protein Vretimale_16646 [Volvox reticuliferus]|uniref:Urease accessory protein UreH-like transmembrane domain-containing protein n=2 Tax=Volvox reticuliferus TaxID=1737510 RepID=A0A8J4GT69_9CHLO|nr:hypothetical protein Vretifemale_17465 [Volvox reticuliferus]GIM13554.1 hypothetical protein Vretimale_16646 [Volvox reticuliferus]